MHSTLFRINILCLQAICLTFLLLVFCSLMTGCTPRNTQQLVTEPIQSPVEFPENYYQQAIISGSEVLQIDTKQSLVTINVHRGGSLARLGHDHVIASHDVTGYVDVTAGRADLYVPLDRLSVDEPGLQKEAGLSTQPSQDAVDGTRNNMLGRVLEAERFPFALIGINLSRTDHSKLDVVITLHNTIKKFEIPTQIDRLQGSLRISGQMTFNQTDFGITPFSILGGALQVQDRVELRYSIIAISI